MVGSLKQTAKDVEINGQDRRSARMVGRRNNKSVSDNTYFEMTGGVSKTYNPRARLADDAVVYGRVLDFVRVRFGDCVHRLAKVELYDIGRADGASGGALSCVSTVAPPFVGYVKCSDIGKKVALCPRFKFEEGSDVISMEAEWRIVLGGTIKQT
jgi:hypothetical protein